MAILIFLDGVLRNTLTNAPIPQGMTLYKNLKEENRVLLLGNNRAKDDRWLREHKILSVDDLVGPESAIGYDWEELRQVEFVRGQGPVDYVITSDPTLAVKLLEIGVTTLMFLHPVYLTEKFRPDSKQGAKPWEEITAEIAKQQEAFVADPRIQ